MTTGDVIRCGYRVQHLYKWDNNARLSHNKTALVCRQQAGRGRRVVFVREEVINQPFFSSQTFAQPVYKAELLDPLCRLVIYLQRVSIACYAERSA